MSVTKPPPHRLTDRLGFRLGFVLSMALLPVGLIAVIQSERVLADAQARVQATLIGQTLRAVAPQMRQVRRSQGAAASLAATLPVLFAGDADCSPLLRAIIRPAGAYEAAMFVSVDGVVRCSAQQGQSDLLTTAPIAAFLASPEPALTSVPVPAAAPLIFVSHPVRSPDGALIGTIALAVPGREEVQNAFEVEAEEDPLRNGLALAVFDRNSVVLTSNIALDALAGLLPGDRDLSALAANGETVVFGRAASGEDRAFSVVSLSDPGLFAMGSWPLQNPLVSQLPTLPALAFPVLMWVVSLIAAFVAAERLVTRHIRDLQVAIMRFASGHRAESALDMSKAPTEIRDASDAFVQMTHTILRDEADLEHALHEKELLLREVHHRVKNNLQLIASIISLQMRETGSVEARQLMRAMHDRVMNLATVHKDLYLAADLTEVRASELMPEIVNQVISLAPGPQPLLQIETDFADLPLTPDRAVPLALLVAEAVTLARNEAAGEGGLPALNVTLQHDGPDHVILAVAHAIEPSALIVPGQGMQTGLGRQLIDAFAAQLGGVVSFSERQGSHRLEIRFPLTEPGLVPPASQTAA